MYTYKIYDMLDNKMVFQSDKKFTSINNATEYGADHLEALEKINEGFIGKLVVGDLNAESKC